MNAILLQILPAVLLAMLHPMLGLIFALAISGRTLVADARQLYVWSVGVAVLCSAMLATGVQPMLNCADIAASLILSMLAFAWTMRRTRSWMGAVLGATGAQAVFAVVRRFAFETPYTKSVETARTLTQQFIENNSQQLGPDQAQALQDLMDRALRFLVDMQEAVWVVPLLIGLYLGALLLAKRTQFPWRHRTTRMPFWLVYAVLAGLGLAMVGQTRLAGLNTLVILAWVYFIQGMMIIDYYWGRYFARSRVLTLVLILAIMLNYFVIALVMMMGLLDTWFNFRKLQDMQQMEDNSGDHSHTGDL